MLQNIFYVLKEQVCCLIFLRKLRCTKQEKEIQNNVSNDTLNWSKVTGNDRITILKYMLFFGTFYGSWLPQKKKKTLFSIDACNTYFLSIKSAY